ncbi:MAG: hypothetical protein AB1756_02260 [Acidobacteriota bacterium]
MRTRIISFIILATVLVAIPVVARDVVRLKSGRALVVNSYRLEGNMLYVMLEKGNEIAFPAAFVDKIDSQEGLTSNNTAIFNRQISLNSGSGYPGEDRKWASGYDSMEKFKEKSLTRGSFNEGYTAPGITMAGNDTGNLIEQRSVLSMFRRNNSPTATMPGNPSGAGKTATISMPVRQNQSVEKGETRGVQILISQKEKK